MKKITITILSFLLLSIGIAQAAANKLSQADIQRLNTVVTDIQQNYIKPVKTSQLIDYALSGMLSKLDPHSDYLSASDLENLDVVTSGKFEGVGIKVVPEYGNLRIITPIDNSPAAKAGIKPGDLLVRINNTPLHNISINQAIKIMLGKQGTSVTLYVIRNNKLLKFTMKRAEIKVPAVRKKLFENHYGYLRIAIFNDTTEAAVKKAIKQLKSQAKGKLYGLIIDLRNNPGGMLEPSVETSDLFLDARKLKTNKLIVYITGKNTPKESFKATRGELLPNVPITVLINSGSASAAEIMAGALQDHGRALVTGSKSFGKGSVQKVFMLDRNHAIKLTVALYYTPNGTSIQAKGIQPNVIIPQLLIPKAKTDTDLAPLYEANLQNHIANGDAIAIQQRLEDTLLHQDFQLYETLNILKGLSATSK